MLIVNGIDLLGLADADEAAKIAASVGRDDIALLFDKIAELNIKLNIAESELDEAKNDSLARWEKNHGDAQQYYAFFHDCFERLDGHYPCPSVSSDYDKNVIFEAIERGL